MGKLKIADIRLSCTLLLEHSEYAKMVDLLRRVCPNLGGAEDWKEFLGIMEGIPQTYRFESVEAAVLFAKALKWTGYYGTPSENYEALSKWAALVIDHHGLPKAAAVQVEWASGLIGLRKYEQAKGLLSAAIPYLSSETLGVAWARLGFALFNLGEPIEAWRKAYASAHPLLTGEELGQALLNEGFCLARNELRAEAREVWLEALNCFKNNHYFLAWTHYNLGMNALRDLQPEAEEHLYTTARLARKPRAAEHRAKAFNGLGAYSRSLGEWARAEAAYREALKSNPNNYAKEQAYRGLARTHYLAGRPVESLETLEYALVEPDLPLQMVQVGRSLALLFIRQPRQARAALEKAGEPQAESDRWLWRIAQAELARQEGQESVALEFLEGLPVQALHAREEMNNWPGLLELLRQAGREVPEPPNYNTKIQIEVWALGRLRVQLNGRPMLFLPTERVGELLVFLLESNGMAASERIIEAFWPNSKPTTKRRTLWELVRDLREVLGWPGSVISTRQSYRLDPTVRWIYDVQQAREQRRVEGRFLDGIEGEWVEEVNEELERYRTAPVTQ